MSWVISNYAVIVTALLAVSEAIAAVPSLKANSVLQVVVGGLKAMKGQK